MTVGLTYDLSATAPSLPGTYSVVATVSDPNYVGSASGSLVISPKAPIFSGYSASTKQDRATAIARDKILSRASDPYGGKVTLSRVFSPSAQGGTVSLVGNNVTYTPAAAFAGAAAGVGFVSVAAPDFEVAARTSSFMTRPEGPEPAIEAVSTPFSAATFLATPDTFAPEGAPAGATA